MWTGGRRRSGGRGGVGCNRAPLGGVFGDTLEGLPSEQRVVEPALGFRVVGLGFGVWGVGFRV